MFTKITCAGILGHNFTLQSEKSWAIMNSSKQVMTFSKKTKKVFLRERPRNTIGQTGVLVYRR